MLLFLIGMGETDNDLGGSGTPRDERAAPGIVQYILYYILLYIYFTHYSNIDLLKWSLTGPAKKKKERRGPARGLEIEARLARGDPKLEVVFDDLGVPGGVNKQKLVSLIGTRTRQFVSINIKDWRWGVPKEIKQQIYDESRVRNILERLNSMHSVCANNSHFVVGCFWFPGHPAHSTSLWAARR